MTDTINNNNVNAKNNFKNVGAGGRGYISKSTGAGTWSKKGALPDKNGKKDCVDTVIGPTPPGPPAKAHGGQKGKQGVKKVPSRNYRSACAVVEQLAEARSKAAAAGDVIGEMRQELRDLKSDKVDSDKQQKADDLEALVLEAKARRLREAALSMEKFRCGLAVGKQHSLATRKWFQAERQLTQFIGYGQVFGHIVGWVVAIFVWTLLCGILGLGDGTWALVSLILLAFGIIRVISSLFSSWNVRRKLVVVPRYTLRYYDEHLEDDLRPDVIAMSELKHDAVVARVAHHEYLIMGVDGVRDARERGLHVTELYRRGAWCNWIDWMFGERVCAVVSEETVNVELLCQIITPQNMRLSLDEKTVWEKFQYSAQSIQTVNQDRYSVFADTTVQDTCLFALNMWKNMVSLREITYSFPHPQ